MSPDGMRLCLGSTMPLGKTRLWGRMRFDAHMSGRGFNSCRLHHILDVIVRLPVGWRSAWPVRRRWYNRRRSPQRFDLDNSNGAFVEVTALSYAFILAPERSGGTTLAVYLNQHPFIHSFTEFSPKAVLNWVEGFYSDFQKNILGTPQLVKVYRGVINALTGNLSEAKIALIRLHSEDIVSPSAALMLDEDLVKRAIVIQRPAKELAESCIRLGWWHLVPEALKDSKSALSYLVGYFERVYSRIKLIEAWKEALWVTHQKLWEDPTYVVAECLDYLEMPRRNYPWKKIPELRQLRIN